MKHYFKMSIISSHIRNEFNFDQLIIETGTLAKRKLRFINSRITYFFNVYFSFQVFYKVHFLNTPWTMYTIIVVWLRKLCSFINLWAWSCSSLRSKFQSSYCTCGRDPGLIKENSNWYINHKFNSSFSAMKLLLLALFLSISASCLAEDITKISESRIPNEDAVPDC